jgi:hypothetical protein
MMPKNAEDSEKNAEDTFFCSVLALTTQWMSRSSSLGFWEPGNQGMNILWITVCAIFPSCLFSHRLHSLHPKR